MQTPAVKRVKLIITKGTNGNLAITCLSAADGFHSGGGEWYHLTYLAGSTRVFARINLLNTKLSPKNTVFNRLARFLSCHDAK